MISATEIKRGTVLKVDNELYVVIDYQHITPGNWRGMVQAKLKSLKQGSVVQKRFRSTDKVDDVYLEHREMEYLYQDGDNYCFMDTESLEQVFIQKDAIEAEIPYIALNNQARISFYDGKPVAVELPSSVILRVEKTDPGAKGDTVTNVFKPATLETG
ncbi:MAG TPA: elongation factor P, partial [Candidatus Brocadiales bacterium]|nr:elongation factor P [Candidatus Brocadiales bacterium]